MTVGALKAGCWTTGPLDGETTIEWDVTANFCRLFAPHELPNGGRFCQGARQGDPHRNEALDCAA